MFYSTMTKIIRDTVNIEASGLIFILSDLDFSVVVVVEVVVLQFPVVMGSCTHMEFSHLNVITCNDMLEFQFRIIFLLALMAIALIAIALPRLLTVFLQTGKKDGMLN